MTWISTVISIAPPRAPGPRTPSVSSMSEEPTTPRVAISAKVPVKLAQRIAQRARAEGRTKQAVINELLGRQLDGEERDILDLPATSEMLGVSEHTLLDRIADGDFPARRFGDEWRCSRQAVLDWLNGTDEPRRKRTWLRADQTA